MGSIVLSGRILEATAGQTIEEAMRSNGFHPDSYLYMVDGKPVPMDTVISDTDNVRAIRVASGG